MFAMGQLSGILVVEVLNKTSEVITDIKIDYTKGAGVRNITIKKVKPNDSKKGAISTKNVTDERGLRMQIGESERVIIWEPIALNMPGKVTVIINGIDENGVLDCSSSWDV